MMYANHPASRRVSPSIRLTPLGWGTSIHLERLDEDGFSLGLPHAKSLVTKCAQLLAAVPPWAAAYARAQARPSDAVGLPRLYRSILPGLALDYDFECEQIVFLQHDQEALRVDFWELAALIGGLSALVDELYEELAKTTEQNHA
jgi:hypothetical protein